MGCISSGEQQLNCFSLSSWEPKQYGNQEELGKMPCVPASCHYGQMEEETSLSPLCAVLSVTQYVKEPCAAS